MDESHIAASGAESRVPMKALSADDLAMLGTPEAPASSLKRIRDHHHRLAMLVAQGKRTGEIAELTGMSLSRVSILKGDPAFQQLVAIYRNKVDNIEFEAFKQVTVTRANVELLALEELRDRLEDTPELFAVRDLQEIISDAADRLGRAKVSRAERLNLNFDLADSLAEARRREIQLSASAAAPPDKPDAEAPGSDDRTPALTPTPVAGDT